MPYRTLANLPDRVQAVLPKHAQEIYRAAFNSAWDQYVEDDERGREARSHMVAWAAVARKYAKGEDGRWHPRDR